VVVEAATTAFLLLVQVVLVAPVAEVMVLYALVMDHRALPIQVAEAAAEVAEAVLTLEAAATAAPVS
jgi:hypothetical protein